VKLTGQAYLNMQTWREAGALLGAAHSGGGGTTTGLGSGGGSGGADPEELASLRQAYEEQQQRCEALERILAGVMAELEAAREHADETVGRRDADVAVALAQQHSAIVDAHRAAVAEHQDCAAAIAVPPKIDRGTSTSPRFGDGADAPRLRSDHDHQTAAARAAAAAADTSAAPAGAVDGADGADGAEEEKGGGFNDDDDDDKDGVADAAGGRPSDADAQRALLEAALEEERARAAERLAQLEQLLAAQAQELELSRLALARTEGTLRGELGDALLQAERATMRAEDLTPQLGRAHESLGAMEAAARDFEAAIARLTGVLGEYAEADAEDEARRQVRALHPEARRPRPHRLHSILLSFSPGRRTLRRSAVP